jgi:hypothetical protein
MNKYNVFLKCSAADQNVFLSSMGQLHCQSSRISSMFKTFGMFSYVTHTKSLVVLCCMGVFMLMELSVNITAVASLYPY